MLGSATSKHGDGHGTGENKWTNCGLAWAPWERGVGVGVGGCVWEECVLQPVAPKAWQPRQGQAVAQADQSQGQRPTGSATGFGSERNLSGFTMD